MKQWQLERFGLSNLALVERPVPAPGPGEALVRIGAVSLNYRDKVVAEGTYLPSLSLPYVPVSDGAGTVAAVGEGVSRVAVGDRVIGHYRQVWLDGPGSLETMGASLGAPLAGMLAEYVVLPAEGLVRTPPHLSDEEAATLPIAALTAWWALFEDGGLKPGETVLVQGTGGVSLFALQLATAAGAHVVATSGSDEKLARARALGARETVNYRLRPDWDAAVLERTSGRGVDHALEVASGSNLARTVQALRVGGHLALIGFLEARVTSVDVAALMRKRARVIAVSTGHRRAFEEMNAAISTLSLRPVIDRVFALEEAPAAFRRLEEGAFGKVVIRVGAS